MGLFPLVIQKCSDWWSGHSPDIRWVFPRFPRGCSPDGKVGNTPSLRSAALRFSTDLFTEVAVEPSV